MDCRPTSTGSPPKPSRPEPGSRRSLRALAAALLCLWPSLSRAANVDLLPPEQAFRFSARALDDRTLEARFAIADGYYLYRDKLKFAVTPEGADAGRAGIARRQDEDRRVLRQGRDLPRNAGREIAAVGCARPARPVVLAAESQGCADVGVCYPPNRQKLTLAAAQPGRRPGRAGRRDAAQEELVQIACAATPVCRRRQSECEHPHIEYHEERSRSGSAAAVVALAALAAGLYFGRADRRRNRRRPRCWAWRCRISTAANSGSTSGKARCWSSISGRPGANPAGKRCPNSSKRRRHLAAKGLQFVGIAIDQPDKIRQFSQELKLNYPSLVGGYGALELSKTLGNKIMALAVHVDRGSRGPDRLHPDGAAQAGKAGRRRRQAALKRSNIALEPEPDVRSVVIPPLTLDNVLSSPANSGHSKT